MVLISVKLNPCLKKALGLRRTDSEVYQSSVHEFNAYVVDRFGCTRLEPGLWLRLLEHLVSCRNCAKHYGIKRGALYPIIRRMRKKMRKSEFRK